MKLEDENTPGGNNENICKTCTGDLFNKVRTDIPHTRLNSFMYKFIKNVRQTLRILF